VAGASVAAKSTEQRTDVFLEIRFFGYLATGKPLVNRRKIIAAGILHADE
jgi:hypothetical protein